MSGKVRYSSEYTSFTDVGRRSRCPKQWVEKNAYWKIAYGKVVACRAAFARPCRLRPRPKRRSGAQRSARPKRRSGRHRAARSGRAPRSAGAARRTGSAQSDRARRAQQLPGRRLHGILPRRRSLSERLLRARTQSSHVHRRTSGFVRHRGQRRQFSTGGDLRDGAAKMRLLSPRRVPICRPREDRHAGYRDSRSVDLR
jgi:hypothetical protein